MIIIKNYLTGEEGRARETFHKIGQINVKGSRKKSSSLNDRAIKRVGGKGPGHSGKKNFFLEPFFQNFNGN